MSDNSPFPDANEEIPSSEIEDDEITKVVVDKYRLEKEFIFKCAIIAVVEKRRASAFVIQNAVAVGQEDATALLDKMTELGLVGKSNGSRPRAVLNLAFETVALWRAEEKLKQEKELSKYSDEHDEFFDEALKICVEMKRASTSVLQRRLRIGYGRAAAILDMMEREGLIAASDGSSRPRAVLPQGYETVAKWNEFNNN